VGSEQWGKQSVQFLLGTVTRASTVSLKMQNHYGVQPATPAQTASSFRSTACTQYYITLPPHVRLDRNTPSEDRVKSTSRFFVRLG